MMITVLGGVPKPVGGVTTFIHRLCCKKRQQIDSVVDLYPSGTKVAIEGVKVRVRPQSLLRSAMWLPLVFMNLGSEIYFFNFSTPRGVLLTMLLPKKRGSVWLLLLHHGDLEGWKMPIGTRWIYRTLMKRFDRIGYIGNRQRIHFISHGIDESTLYPLTTYLPYNTSLEEDEGEDCMGIEETLARLRARYDKIFVISGYPSSIYRYEWVHEYFENYKGSARCAVLFCVYGVPVESVLPKLKAIVSQHEHYYLFKDLGPAQFQRVLKSSDVYLRPTSVDSYGVAVAEAIALGLLAIASDACERHKGAHIFEKEDKSAFFELLDAAISESIDIADTVSDSTGSHDTDRERLNTFLLGQ